MIDSFFDWLIDWLIDWLFDWLIDWLMGWMICWFWGVIYCVIDSCFQVQIFLGAANPSNFILFMRDHREFRLGSEMLVWDSKGLWQNGSDVSKKLSFTQKFPRVGGAHRKIGKASPFLNHTPLLSIMDPLMGMIIFLLFLAL